MIVKESYRAKNKIQKIISVVVRKLFTEEVSNNK